MATTWPFAGFGSMQFKSTERALPGTDKGWTTNPTYARSRPLGSTRDDIVTLAIGSMEREFEANFELSRLAILRALINTGGVFTGWLRPVPDQQQAFLANVEPLDQEVATVCSDANLSHQRVRVRISLISQ